MRRMRLARLARLGFIPRRVPSTAIDRDPSSASTDTIVHSRTRPCCNSEGTVAATNLQPAVPHIRFFVVIIPFTNHAGT